jgi:hypothetical protein
VVVGAWNPAIFQGGWITRHLFDVPAGQQVQLAQLIAPQKIPKVILYYRGLGISVSTERLELYPNDLSEEMQRLSENTLAMILEKLPHTPTGAFGVNFRFVEDAPSPELLDIIDTKESLDQRYAITKQRFTSTILIDATQLTLLRIADANAVTIDFNYQYASCKLDLLAGVVTTCLKHATELLEEIYDLAGYTTSGHQRDNPPD